MTRLKALRQSTRRRFHGQMTKESPNTMMTNLRLKNSILMWLPLRLAFHHVTRQLQAHSRQKQIGNQLRWHFHPVQWFWFRHLLRPRRSRFLDCRSQSARHSLQPCLTNGGSLPLPQMCRLPNQQQSQNSAPRKNRSVMRRKKTSKVPVLNTCHNFFCSIP